MTETIVEHPLRASLVGEFHARPYARLEAPLSVSHLAVVSGKGRASAEWDALVALFGHFAMTPPDEGAGHYLGALGPLGLKWERHTEFCTYTFFRRLSSGARDRPAEPFAQPAIALVPAEWLAALPGEVLVALHLEVEEGGAPERDLPALAAIFGSDDLAGSRVAGGAARIWSDFALGTEGFGRILLEDQGLGARQRGRLVQRLLETETYRMMALLAFPLAKRYGPELDALAERLTDIAGRLNTIATLDDERRLLARLTALAAEIEEAAVATSYRFAAARAYHSLVGNRLEALRETRLAAVPTFAEFVERRLDPAMRTCVAIGERLERLSQRVTRAGDLLRTRVEIEVEAQNSALLQSMDRRARLQLRLQETVEGLSVAAISYYLVGLVAYGAKALKQAGIAVEPDIVSGLAIPVVVALVGYGIIRIRRAVGKSLGDGD